MEKQMLMSAALRFFRTVMLLLLVACSCPLVTSSPSASNALPALGDLTYPYGNIFSPLLKALSEHGGSRWNPGLKKKMKPEHRYMKYLTEVYKKPSRVQRSVDGNKLYNTVRLIKPHDECPAQSNDESFMQELSYSLDQVRRKEQLLKSALLYNFNHAHSTPVSSVCYLSIKEQEQWNQCQLCPGIHRAVNFTASADGGRWRSWVEIDVTTFLQPLLKFQKKNIHLLINITCPHEQRARADGHRSPLEFILRSPPLLLYLSDTSKINHQRLLENTKAGQRPPTASNTFQKQMVFKPEQRRKRRWKREAPKSKRGDKSLDIHLPELLPSSEFPTGDCALYDFRVRFSQLKLDHWIVFPPKYNPRYCRGICPRTMGFIYGSPVHTMVQNIIYEKLDSSVPRPSCVPSHYSPLSVMIFEEDGSYVYKEFEDMVATRCTCR
uniref:Growth differentiation factor 9 n=1 Tax=Acanthochromis polyacanthus TaxID=80966 RepID=A0A3Q1GK23_9TELE